MTINLKPSEDKNIFDIPTDCKALTGNYYKVTNIKGSKDILYFFNRNKELVQAELMTEKWAFDPFRPTPCKELNGDVTINIECGEYDVVFATERYIKTKVFKGTTIAFTNDGNYILVENVVEPFGGYVELNDGRYLMNSYGKYSPDLTFINTTPDARWTDIKALDLNLPEGDLSVMHGNYFVSKKGTRCFEITPHGRHILVRDSWGGAFNSYRGHTLPDTDHGALYYRRASSNGGGTGNDFAVLPKDWRNKVSVDDI